MNAPTLLEHIQTLDWQSVPDPGSEIGCWAYQSIYMERIRQAEEAGDALTRDAYLVLWKATSLRLVPENPDMPFEAVLVFRSSRTPILDDLIPEELDVVCSIAPTAQNVELRTRLADVCWVTRKKYESALLAIDSYLDLAKIHNEQGGWIGAKDYLERALWLSRLLGRGNQGRFNRAVSQIESDLENHDHSDHKRRLQPWHWMSLLLEFGAGDASKWIVLSEQLAAQLESQQEWESVQNYFLAAAKWAEKLNDEPRRKANRILAAEQYVRIADFFVSRPNPDYLSGSIHLSRAVEAMRQAGNSTRAHELHRSLLEIQALADTQMQSFSHKLDLSDAVDSAMAAVRSKSFPEAVLTLAWLCRPQSVVTIRETVEEYVARDQFGFLFTKEKVNSRGRVIAVAPSLTGSDGQYREEALFAEMFEHSTRHRLYRAGGIIDPARFQIVTEHRIRIEDILPFVVHNPMVSEGYEEIVARGLQAGFNADYLVASHLLVPQIEQSLRHMLNRNGIITTSLDQKGVQQESDLRQLLLHPVTSETFGEDLVFDLRGLLIEAHGNNFRNEMAHGLISHDYFYSASSICVWGTSLWYFCFPSLVSNADTADPNDAA